jgi:hypothetical protein
MTEPDWDRLERRVAEASLKMFYAGLVAGVILGWLTASLLALLLGK